MGEIRKSVISVTEMANLVGLSRQRFNQLVKAGIFPSPDHDPTTNRPFYDATKQQDCLMVRQTNTGINGKPILFYARRSDKGIKKGSSRKPKPKASSQHELMIEHLDQLGVHVTYQQIDAAMPIVFPNGIENLDFDSQFKGLFLHFRRKKSSDSGGR